MTRDEWLALAERCEKATGADRETTEGILSGIGYRFRMGVWWRPALLSAAFPDANRIMVSLDAITALIERELPKRHWGFVSERSDFNAYGWIADDAGRDGPAIIAATPALALCAAFCRAMAEKEPT